MNTVVNLSFYTISINESYFRKIYYLLKRLFLHYYIKDFGKIAIKIKIIMIILLFNYLKI
jgi:hypothetical protein